MAFPRLLEAVRRNHALEHATITILTQRQGGRRILAGHSTVNGFSIYGALDPGEVEEATGEALRRLKGGESDLAISPFCGTNIIVTGLLVGVATLAAVGGRNRLGHVPRALMAAIGAALGAQPLGALAQKYLTTSAQLQGMQIRSVRRHGHGPVTTDIVQTFIQEGHSLTRSPTG